jgi:CRP/FNR family cyclic AMP-dependent transcriptional regulator
MGLESEHSCLWYIRNLNFFPAMSGDETIACAKLSKMITARKGETIALPEETGQHAWLVKEGHVRLVRNLADGRTLATDVLGPGEIIGELAMMDSRGGDEAAEAVDDVLLCRVSADFLRDLCARNAQLTLHIGKLIGLRRMRIESRLADLLFCTVPVRVAKLLLQLSEKFGRPEGNGTLIDLRLTHQELADLVGANREAVTRAIDGLLDRYLVRYEGRRIVILDRAGLEGLADPSGTKLAV